MKSNIILKRGKTIKQILKNIPCFLNNTIIQTQASNKVNSLSTGECLNPITYRNGKAGAYKTTCLAAKVLTDEFHLKTFKKLKQNLYS